MRRQIDLEHYGVSVSEELADVIRTAEKPYRDFGVKYVPDVYAQAQIDDYAMAQGMVASVNALLDQPHELEAFRLAAIVPRLGPEAADPEPKVVSSRASTTHRTNLLAGIVATSSGMDITPQQASKTLEEPVPNVAPTLWGLKSRGFLRHGLGLGLNLHTHLSGAFYSPTLEFANELALNPKWQHAARYNRIALALDVSLRKIVEFPSGDLDVGSTT